jgi:hypothetical protein
MGEAFAQATGDAGAKFLRMVRAGRISASALGAGLVLLARVRSERKLLTARSFDTANWRKVGDASNSQDKALVKLLKSLALPRGLEGELRKHR